MEFKMTDKLNIILKTAQSLLDDYPEGWTGDVYEFATASAYVTPDERLWLTSGDVTAFHSELDEGAFVSEYAYVSASYEGDRPIMIIEDVDSGKV